MEEQYKYRILNLLVLSIKKINLFKNSTKKLHFSKLFEVRITKCTTYYFVILDKSKTNS